MSAWDLRSGALLAAILACVAGCSRPAPGSPEAQKAPEVTVSHPVVREVLEYFEYPGQTAAVGEVEIRSRVTGYIVKVNFQDGQEVKAGDVLYEIDPRPFRAALDRASAELARLKALQVKAQANMDRAQKLLPSGAASKEDFDDCVAQLSVAKASIASGEALVRDAQLNLEYTKVTSPINGRVSSAKITLGNLVQPPPGDSTVLTTVVTTNPVYVYFNMDERTFLRCRDLVMGPGKEVAPAWVKKLDIRLEIGLPNEQGFPHTGTLDFVDNKVSPGTGTIRVRGVFENAGQLLTPGLYVRVRLPAGAPRPALLISERAIVTEQGQKLLMAVNAENIVESRLVKLGPLRDRLRVIEEGIAADDWVIVNGLMRARPGRPVTPQRAEGGVESSSLADGRRAGQGAAARN